MGQYTSIRSRIFSIFGSIDWKDEEIKTFPSNFTGNVGDSDYIRVTVLVSENSSISISGNSGMLNIDIFTKAGLGPNASDLIADTLDKYLLHKTVAVQSSSIQFGKSSLSHMGACRDNSSLHRALYTIPFNYFGAN